LKVRFFDFSALMPPLEVYEQEIQGFAQFWGEGTHGIGMEGCGNIFNGSGAASLGEFAWLCTLDALLSSGEIFKK
jgi:hypothetical protein